jgi:ferredoxin
MTHIVNEKCIKCKYTTCVEVCPVSCFYEANNMLAINPDECIDCGVCIPECPIEAIENDILPDNSSPERRNRLNELLRINRELSLKFKKRNITQVKSPMPEAEYYREQKDKLARFYDENLLD